MEEFKGDDSHPSQKDSSTPSSPLQEEDVIPPPLKIEEDVERDAIMVK